MLREYLLIGCGFALYNCVNIMLLADKDCMYMGNDVSGSDLAADFGGLLGSVIAITLWPLILISNLVSVYIIRKCYWVELKYNQWSED